MGAPMAKNLLKSKYQVKVFNRTKKKADKLKNYGAKVCNSLKEVVSDQDLIITMLTDDEAVEKVLSNEDFLNNLKKSSTVIDMSSTKPTISIKYGNLLKNKGVNSE